MRLITTSLEAGAAVDRVAPTAAVLCQVADVLSARESLRPSPTVDSLFTRLVETIVGTPEPLDRHVLADPRINARADEFRRLSGRGEHELELHWSARVLASPTPKRELARFPYHDNYRRLALMEAGALSAFLDEPARSLAFVGSGPLPLSAIMLARHLGVAVDGFDRDADAVRAARGVVAVAGDVDVQLHAGDAADIDVSRHDVVVLAALVGSTPAEKAVIVRRLRRTMHPGAILLARSARGLRTLLYPPVDEAALPGFEVLTVIHPVNDIVNSIVVARATGED